MNCPSCGKWNRAHFTSCQFCGEKLNSGQLTQPEWKNDLKDHQRGKQYIRVDDLGEAVSKPDMRDSLAQEMSDLKVRKAQGRQRQRQLRQESAQRGSAPSSLGVKTMHNNDDVWSLSDSPNYHAQSESHSPKASYFESLVPEEELFPSDVWHENEFSKTYQLPALQATGNMTRHLPVPQHRSHRLRFVLSVILFTLLIASTAYFGYFYFTTRPIDQTEDGGAIITASILNDLSAHTIMIPAEDGTQIYIRELHTSYIAAGGFATIEVADYVWYEDTDNLTQETKQITLTPFIKTTSGKQKPMDPIKFTIDIPLSPIKLITPDSPNETVATTMYTMKFQVRPGSTVLINGKDVSDAVDSEDGTMSYNATVQPIGDNVYTVQVRSQYCRENSMKVTLYRETQEIPLDLAADTYSSTSSNTMKVNCTTLPGAFVEVLSPHSDLNITNVDRDGTFSFYAIFNTIGDNEIVIKSSKGDMKPSEIVYKVYYLPPASVYTPKAWKLDESGYAELVGNIQVRTDRKQIYLVTGTVQYEVSSKPQMVVINTSADGQSQPVLVENFTKNNWEVGQWYRIYADVNGSYNSMPRLSGRYSYKTAK